MGRGSAANGTGRPQGAYRTGCESAASFSPDGTRIVTASEDKTARLWDATTGEPLAVLQGHTGAARSAAFSPDGTRIVTASVDNTARLWDAITGEPLAVLKGHTRSMYSAAFSPDGTRIVTASWDNTARLWDASTGEPLAVLKGHTKNLCSAAFSPDGTRIVTASWCRVQLWDSVPYAQRYQERRDAEAALPEARALVDRLHVDLGNWRGIVAAIRADTTLTDPVRRQALNEVLRRSGQERQEIIEAAETLTAPLFREYGSADAVVEQLQNDQSLSPRVQDQAIKLAEQIGDDPWRLNLLSWDVVRQSDQLQELYASALRLAVAASGLAPENAAILNTLGVAQYRTGAYQQALATLTSSDKLRGGHPEDVAFLAMALHQLGRTDEAKAALERLRTLMQDPNRAYNEESQGFLREAEALIEGKPSPNQEASDSD